MWQSAESQAPICQWGPGRSLINNNHTTSHTLTLPSTHLSGSLLDERSLILNPNISLRYSELIYAMVRKKYLHLKMLNHETLATGKVTCTKKKKVCINLISIIIFFFS